MTYSEALAYIHSVQWQKNKPGLHRIRLLLERLGNPQNHLRFVHVAGTNGKGSTCACLNAIFQQGGYRTGLFTSPFIARFNERLQVNSVPIPDEELCALVEQIRPLADAMPEKPTEFELICAIAMVWFRAQHCDIVVLEVGLGGTLDPTNVIPPPEAAVICAIDLDHTGILGHTVGEVAASKAGIIKPGCPVIYYGGNPDADQVIAQACRTQSASLHLPHWGSLTVTGLEPDVTVMDYDSLKGIRLPLLATYQPRNAAMAIACARILSQAGWNLPDSVIRAGLEQVRWPGRFELLRRDPLFLLDGSHNPHGIRATAQSIADRWPGVKFRFLMAVMADKDVSAMIGAVAPLALDFVTIAPPLPRAMPAEELARRITAETGLPARSGSDVAAGVAMAVDAPVPVFALGSLYVLEDIRQAFLSL